MEQEGQSHPVVVSSFNDSVVTPIDVERLEYELRSHPKPTFVGKLCKELREGAHIGYEGPRLAREANNLPTANSNPTKVTQNIEKEVSMGRTAGPFREPPFENFQVSPLGLVPKKNSEKFRTIFHLSYPKAGDSINSAIEGEKYSLSYVTIDDAIRAIQELGPRTHMAKTDIESAFRLFPVHPDDWELLGMKWQGLYYFDKVLPFGLRSAPFLFNQLSEGVEWILKEKCAISYVCHLLDDFLILEPKSAQGDESAACQVSLTSMISTFRNLGIPLSPGKTQGPSTELEFLGIVLDSDSMVARLPEDKVTRLSEELAKWSFKKHAKLVEIQSLVGSLAFACKVIPPVRVFLQRIINLMCGLKKQHHRIKLTRAFFADLEMWKQFLVGWNGKAFFLNPYWESSVDLQLHTDASGVLGYGGICGSQWFQGRWQPHQMLGARGISINWQELFAIVAACAIWGCNWSRKQILLNCDNQAVVEVINSKKSKCESIMKLLRHLTLITMSGNFHIKARHVPGVQNELADSLSRFQVTRFRTLAPSADSTPQQIPPSILQL